MLKTGLKNVLLRNAHVRLWPFAVVDCVPASPTYILLKSQSNPNPVCVCGGSFYIEDLLASPAISWLPPSGAVSGLFRGSSRVWCGQMAGRPPRLVEATARLTDSKQDSWCWLTIKTPAYLQSNWQDSVFVFPYFSGVSLSQTDRLSGGVCWVVWRCLCVPWLPCVGGGISSERAGTSVLVENQKLASALAGFSR